MGLERCIASTLYTEDLAAISCGGLIGGRRRYWAKPVECLETMIDIRAAGKGLKDWLLKV